MNLFDYLPGDNFSPNFHRKLIRWPSEKAPDNLSLLFCDESHVNYAKRHSQLKGVLPPIGCYELQDCYVGAHGMLLSRSRKILDAPDLITPFWRTYLPNQLQANASTFETLRNFMAEDPRVPVRILPDGITVISLANPGCQIYGHWMIDILPMLWVYK